MSTVTLTAHNIEQAILQPPEGSSGIVIVDFWASWCGPCRRFAPTFEAASERHPDIVFGKVDTEAEQALAAAANITSIPTLMAFKDGVVVFAQAGALPPATLEDLIAQLRALDMEQVRANMAGQAATAGQVSTR